MLTVAPAFGHRRLDPDRDLLVRRETGAHRHIEGEVGHAEPVQNLLGLGRTAVVSPERVVAGRHAAGHRALQLRRIAEHHLIDDRLIRNRMADRAAHIDIVERRNAVVHAQVLRPGNLEVEHRHIRIAVQFGEILRQQIERDIDIAVLQQAQALLRAGDRPVEHAAIEHRFLVPEVLIRRELPFHSRGPLGQRVGRRAEGVLREPLVPGRIGVGRVLLDRTRPT